MFKKLFNNKQTVLLIFILAFIVLGAGMLQQRQPAMSSEAKQIPSEQTVPASNFGYKGEEGKDVLTLLKKSAQIRQDKSGMVISINGRKADNNKREFWAFYINGEQAQVGPADYQTKQNENIEWKIETY